LSRERSLSDDQRRVLEALMDKDATADEKTDLALVQRTGIARVVKVLVDLEAFDPPLVGYDEDSKLGVRVWWATPAAADQLDEA
jgi:hypothetical protein